MKLSKLASAMPFAHYLGLSGSAAAAAEDDEDRKQKEGESDDDYAKRMEQMDEEEEKARKAEEEKKEEEARKAEEEKKKEEARRARKADADEDDEADMEDEDDDAEAAARSGRAAAARQRERIRCAKILAAGIKAGRVNQACVFAFDTALNASAAVSALGAAALDAPARRGGLGERMSAVKVANPGTNTGAAAQPKDPAAAAAARIIAAGERARGGK